MPGLIGRPQDNVRQMAVRPTLSTCMICGSGTLLSKAARMCARFTSLCLFTFIHPAGGRSPGFFDNTARPTTLRLPPFGTVAPDDPQFQSVYLGPLSSSHANRWTSRLRGVPDLRCNTGEQSNTKIQSEKTENWRWKRGGSTQSSLVSPIQGQGYDCTPLNRGEYLSVAKRVS